jgi:nitrous oxide reductase accessory protein NosL
MNVVKVLLLGLLLLLSFNGCEKKKITTELHEVHWDRDMCERCKMVTSDRHHAVQVINPENGKSYMFDDIGCTLLWFDDEKITWKDKAKVWITDVETGKWIDARTAFYDTHNITPMAYGFAAHEKKERIKAGEEIVRYNDLFKRILEIEEKNNNRKAY